MAALLLVFKAWNASAARPSMRVFSKSEAQTPEERAHSKTVVLAQSVGAIRRERKTRTHLSSMEKIFCAASNAAVESEMKADCWPMPALGASASGGG